MSAFLGLRVRQHCHFVSPFCSLIDHDVANKPYRINLDDDDDDDDDDNDK